LLGGLLVQREGNWAGRGRSTPTPVLAVPNVTAYPTTASVPITILLHCGPLLCGFNVPLKGKSSWCGYSPMHRVRSSDGLNPATHSHTYEPGLLIQWPLAQTSGTDLHSSIS